MPPGGIEILAIVVGIAMLLSSVAALISKILPVLLLVDALGGRGWLIYNVRGGRNRQAPGPARDRDWCPDPPRVAGARRRTASPAARPAPG